MRYDLDGRRALVTCGYLLLPPLALERLTETTGGHLLGERRGDSGLLSFERQPVEEEVSQGVGILVVLEHAT
jgi:hypothetical protein